jgi:hypothetical protein
MDTSKPGNQSNGLMAVLGKAVVDPVFRDRLYKEPDAVGSEHKLAPDDIAALKTIDRSKIEEAATQMKTRPQIAISIVIRIKF